MSTTNLVTVYVTLIRPVLEYGCIVWHFSLPLCLSDRLESIRKRPLRIILPHHSYVSALEALNLPSCLLCPRSDLNPQLSMIWLDALTTELLETQVSKGEMWVFDWSCITQLQSQITTDNIAHNCSSSQRPTFCPCSPESPVAQWLEHPTRSWSVVGSNSIWGSDFSEFPVDSIDISFHISFSHLLTWVVGWPHL